LIDDEPTILDLLGKILRRSGFVVVSADGPRAALAMLTSENLEQLDVAILDYNMPGMNGCLLAQRLKAMRPELKIILHSGAFDIPESELTSVDVLVPKGGDMGALIVELAQLLPREWPPAPDFRATERSAPGEAR
jgi:CheY-like chemotaxis protein